MLEINHVYNEDCLVGMKRIPDKSIDMILCDLPYGTTHCKWDSIIPLDLLWEQYERIIKDSGAIVLTAQSPFSEVLAVSKLDLFRYRWVWEKTEATGHLNAKKMPMKAHEDILVFYKKLPTYNPIKTQGHERKTASRNRSLQQNNHYGKMADAVTTYDSTERYPRSVLKFAKEKQYMNLHPTQKPAALFEYLVLTYTNKGDTVLDNCMGSGTSAVVCIKNERDFIGFENDVEHGFYDIILERIEKAKKAKCPS
ncbi:MAG: site-specific DNA-methyltransferase [Sulfuricurvum sp.]|nr:site-specific DNA-methyltransferase [Sulfuricurvum sp.]